jgi:hypothetical protein
MSDEINFSELFGKGKDAPVPDPSYPVITGDTTPSDNLNPLIEEKPILDNELDEQKKALKEAIEVKPPMPPVGEIPPVLVKFVAKSNQDELDALAEELPSLMDGRLESDILLTDAYWVVKEKIDTFSLIDKIENIDPDAPVLTPLDKIEKV